MKQPTILLAILLSISGISKAQVDTVLFENFQFDVVTTLDSMATGVDTTWINVDEDGLEPQLR